jgi:hypothetical protein
VIHPIGWAKIASEATHLHSLLQVGGKTTHGDWILLTPLVRRQGTLEGILYA